MYQIIKNVYKIRFRRDHFETCNIWAKRKGLSVVIKLLSPMCRLRLPGAIYMWKNMKKTCIKTEFKEIVLKLATNWQSDKQSKKISNDQELIQSDPISCPQNQKGNN